MIKFHELEVDAKDLIKPKGRRVHHCWGRNWTRIEMLIPDTWDSPTKIADWIDSNLSNGRYGFFYMKDKCRNNNDNDLAFHWNDAQVLVIGFENEDDALMFKLLDGHLAHEELN